MLEAVHGFDKTTKDFNVPQIFGGPRLVLDSLVDMPEPLSKEIAR